MKYLVSVFLLFLLVSIDIIFAQRIPMKDFGNSNLAVNMVEFNADGSKLIAGGILKMWDISNTEIPVFKSAETGMEFAYANVLNGDISADRRYVAATSIGRIEIYDLFSMAKIKIIRGMKLSSVAFGPQNQLASVSTNGTLNIYNAPYGKPIFSKKFKVNKPLRIAWSPSGKLIAFGGHANNVILYNREDNSVTPIPGVGKKFVSDIEFSPDSKYLAISDRSGTVTVVDTEEEKEPTVWIAHPKGTWALAFHPESKLLATGGVNNVIAVWGAPDWKPVTSWTAHDKTVTALSFSPDGNMLASGSNNVPVGGVSDTRIWALDEELKQQILAQGNARLDNKNQVKVDKPVISEIKEKELLTNIVADQKRLALIIGNGMYQNGGILANPENDANDIGARLQTLGFDVMLFNNLDQSSFKKAIDDFGSRLAEYEVGLFYYAGHGIQVKGNNYLIPVDANLKTENDVEYDCVNAGRLLAKMEDAGSTTNIIILDACRDNPFERSWRRSAHGGGLAFMTAPAGSLISYATSPGATASDGSGDNGLFTSALLEYMEEANLSLLEMFQKVRTYVRQNSDGEQVPWESTSLEGNFYFKMK